MKEPLFTRMSAQELLERYAAGQRNFAGISLTARRWELNGAILKEANFSGAMLDVSIVGADFTGCYFNGADLVQCSLEDVILRQVRLFGANLHQTGFHSVDLSHACLDHAEMDETLLDRVNLHGASLIGASGVDIEYWLEKGCIFCRTTMPDRTVRNDGCQYLGITVV